MKRKLIIEEWLSLDGYVATKDGSLDFFTQHVRHSYSRRAEELAPHRLSLLETTSYADGVVLLRYSNLADKT